VWVQTVNPAKMAAQPAGDGRQKNSSMAGEWPAGTDPELRARLITATLHGMMAQWHLAPGSFS
jgi:hypothetical protein